MAELRTNDAALFKQWLCGGVQDLGEPAVTGLLLDWLKLFTSETVRDRQVARRLEVSL